MHADEPPLTGEPHPKVWDLICVGTGLAETMLARCACLVFPVAPLGTRSIPAPRSRARRPRLTPSPPPVPRRSAAARAGKSVLQLDPADAYGGAFGALAESPGGVGWDVPSSANLERRAATRDASEKSASEKSDADEDSSAETAIVFPALGAPVDARARLGATSYCSPATPSGSSRRQFSLDRSGPRLALGADAFVGVLVRSGAHAYVEFKALDATAIFSRDAAPGTPGGFRAVPASRAEVFRDKTLGLTEKRALMRVLKRVVRLAERGGVVVGAGDPDAADAAVGAPGSEWRAASDGPPGHPACSSLPEEEDPIAPLYEREDELFSVALERLGLGPPRASASLATRFALALSGDDAETARRGFESLTTYLASLHRFGPDVGAALLPLYGAAEFPQAFARLAAVRGATCALRVGARRAYVESIKPEPNSFELATEPKLVTVLTEGGQRLRCRALAAAADATTRVIPSPAKEAKNVEKTSKNATRATRWISRATAVVDGACVFFPSEGEAHAPEERSKRERSTLAVFPPGSVRGAPAGAAIRVAQLGAATGACPRGKKTPKEDENASGGWRVLQASVASSHPQGSAEDDLRGVLELLADTSSLRGYGAESFWETPSEAATESADVSVAENAENAAKESAKEKETRAEKPRASSSERRSRPRAVWVSFHREVAPDDAQTFVASWSALPRNVVTCPGPDARADFADLVAVAEAAAARLWGVEASKRFFSPAARERDDGAAGAADRGTRTGDSDEDEMDALLRDLPGGIGA